ncbi:hypothetical protein EBR78_02255 [bacterium]|nr:hypothetical protein [bacterium]
MKIPEVLKISEVAIATSSTKAAEVNSTISTAGSDKASGPTIAAESPTYHPTSEHAPSDGSTKEQKATDGTATEEKPTFRWPVEGPRQSEY